jgi:hypothetical protein
LGSQERTTKTIPEHYKSVEVLVDVDYLGIAQKEIVLEDYKLDAVLSNQ